MCMNQLWTTEILKVVTIWTSSTNEFFLQLEDGNNPNKLVRRRGGGGLVGWRTWLKVRNINQFRGENGKWDVNETSRMHAIFFPQLLHTLQCAGEKNSQPWQILSHTASVLLQKRRTNIIFGKHPTKSFKGGIRWAKMVITAPPSSYKLFPSFSVFNVIKNESTNRF